MHAKKNSQTNFRPTPGRMYALIGILAFSVLWLIVSGLFISYKLNQSYAPKLAAIMESKFELATAHLRLADSLHSPRSGDTESRVEHHLNRAEQFSHHLFSEHDKGWRKTFFSLDEHFQRQARIFYRELLEFQTLTRKILASPEIFEQEDAYRHYHDLYEGLLERGGYLENDLRMAGERIIQRFFWVQGLLLLPCLLLILLMGWLLRRYHHHQQAHLRHLHQINREKSRQVRQRQSVEERLRHLNRIQRVLRHINQLVMEEDQPERLIQRSCEVLVENLNYYGVWIALTDPAGHFHHIANNGFGDDFQFMVQRLTAGKLPECARRAWTTGETVIVREVTRDCPDCPLSNVYQGRSTLVMRISYGGQAFGLLSFSIPAEHLEHTLKEEQALFEELGSDLAFTLYKQTLQKKQRLAEREAERWQHLFSRLVAHIPGAVFQYEQNGREEQMLYISPGIRELYALPPEAIMADASLFWSYLHPEDKPRILASLQQAGREMSNWNAEWRICPPDEETRWIKGIARPTRRGREQGLLWDGVLLDISDLKKSEQRLRDSQIRYQELFDNMNSGVVVYEALDDGEKFILRDINRAGEIISQIRKKEAIGKDIREIYPEIEKMGLYQLFRQVWHSGQATYQPTTLYQDNRISQWVENRVYRLPSGELVAVFDDATQRRRAEEALAREIEVNAALAELSKKLIATSSLEEISMQVLEQALYLSDSHLGFVGYIDPKTGWLICPTMTYHIWESCHVPDKDIVFKEFGGLWGWVLNHKKPLLTNSPEGDSRSSGTPEGHLPIQRFLSAPAMLEQQLVGQIALANSEQDYTEQDRQTVERLASLYALAVQRKHTEQALRTALAERESREKLLNFAIRQMPVPVIIASAPDVTITHINPPAMEMTVKPAQNPTTDIALSAHLEFWPMFHPDGTPYQVEDLPLARAVQHGETQANLEVLLRDGQGGERWVSANAAPLYDEEGNIMAGIVVFPEITLQKQAAETLRKAHDQLEGKVVARTRELRQANIRLQELAQMKDEFLANMSHELRTPLNAILTGVEILQEQVYGQLNDKQSQITGRIQASSQHLLGMISEILDVAKIEAGRLELQLGDSLPQEICQNCLMLVKEPAQKKHIQLKATCPDDFPVIQVDARRLKQILLNLLGNAIKFTPEHGRVGLECELDRERNTVRFIVWDTGIGIPEDMLDKMFQPFVQLDSELSRCYEGTGLGLALVKSLTDLHGGSVKVESTVNQGSRFTVNLPWIPAEHAETAEEGLEPESASLPCSEAASSAPKPLILVVEDNLGNQAMMRDYLLSRGYPVVLATEGAEAVRQAIAHHPAAIFMDVQMPGMDGLEATRRIRQEPGLESVPIIALTALAMPGDREHCLRAGASEYVTKPVVMKQLLVLLENLLADC